MAWPEHITRIEFTDTGYGADPICDCRRYLRANGIRVGIHNTLTITDMDPEVVAAKLSAIFEYPVTYHPERRMIYVHNETEDSGAW